MKPPISTSTVAFILAATVGCSESMPTQPIVMPKDALYAKQGTTGSRMLYYDYSAVWIMNENGSGATPLTLPADQSFDPSWAPDGKRVLFNAAKGESQTSIYIMNPDGSAVTRITRPPAGSGDTRPTKFGKGIAFVRLGGPTLDIYRINIDGSGETLIVSGWGPAASPSGDRLAYVSDGDIYEYNTASKQSVNLTNTPNVAEIDPSYSPNGKQIAFAARSLVLSGIYVMRANGTAVTRIISSSTDRHELPKWSPDGKRLAFSLMSSNFTQDVYVMNADGIGVANITNSPATSELLTGWAR